MVLQIRPENQSSSLPYYWIRQRPQSKNLPGEFEGAKSAATSQSLGDQGYSCHNSCFIKNCKFVFLCEYKLNLESFFFYNIISNENSISNSA